MDLISKEVVAFDFVTKQRAQREAVRKPVRLLRQVGRTRCSALRWGRCGFRADRSRAELRSARFVPVVCRISWVGQASWEGLERLLVQFEKLRRS